MTIFKNRFPLLIATIGFPVSFYGGRMTVSDSGEVAPDQAARRATSVNGARSGGRGERSGERWSTLSDQEAGDVFDFEGYRRVTSPAGAEALLQDLLSSMSSDPERIFAFAQEHEAVIGEDGMELLLLGWTRNDPEAAWEVAKVDYPERTDEVLGEMGKSEPELALKLARELHKGNFEDGHAAISGIIRGAYHDGRYEKAIGLIELLGKESYGEGGSDGSSLYQVVLDEWTRFSPVEAAQWVQGFPDDGTGAKGRVEEALVENWTNHDPRASLQYFLDELPEGGLRTNGITSALTAWAGEDIHAASGWIVDHGISAEFDEAAYHVALSGDLLEEHPVTSLEWMRSLSNPELENKGLGKVYSSWLRNDPEAAAAHLEAAGGEVPQELRESIQANYEAYLTREETEYRIYPE